MKITAYILSLMMIASCCLSPQKVNAYEAEFHEDITEHAIDESNLDSYLESNLGFGVKESFRGPRPSGFLLIPRMRSGTVKDWIIYGSWKEDKPMGIGARASKHFCNPTYPLYPRYLNDMPTELLYQLNPNLISAWERAKIHTDDEEPYSWEDVKVYYYKALTSEKEIVEGEDYTITPHSRSWYFAQTFRGLGQVLHLLEDMGVPAHVRNDNHVPIVAGKDIYEERIRSVPPASIPSPVKFDAFDHYWDSDVNANAYGDGLAEYTNYNFLSDDTIFKDSTDSLHYFEHPDKDNTDYSYFDALMPEVVVAEDGKNDTRYYIHPKAGTYAPVYIAALGYFAAEMDSAGTGYWKKTCKIDDLVADAYAQKLVPKTISYAAGLINYFFRGKFEISPEEVTGATITVTNKSGEDITGGVLKLYYDYQKKGEEEIKRFEVPEYSSPEADLENLVLENDASFSLNFSPIIGVANYIIVFKGTLGQENNAVIGKVFKAKFPSITELMRAINEREVAAGLSQTEFYNYATGESLGVPDGGVNVPALDALDGYPLVFQYILDLRKAIERLAEKFWSALYDTYGVPRAFDWTPNSPYNLYHIAMGEGWDWGYFGEEMYIEEILKCIETCDWVLLPGWSGEINRGTPWWWSNSDPVATWDYIVHHSVIGGPTWPYFDKELRWISGGGGYYTGKLGRAYIRWAWNDQLGIKSLAQCKVRCKWYSVTYPVPQTDPSPSIELWKGGDTFTWDYQGAGFQYITTVTGIDTITSDVWTEWDLPPEAIDIGIKNRLYMKFVNEESYPTPNYKVTLSIGESYELLKFQWNYPVPP